MEWKQSPKKPNNQSLEPNSSGAFEDSPQCLFRSEWRWQFKEQP